MKSALTKIKSNIKVEVEKHEKEKKKKDDCEEMHRCVGMISRKFKIDELEKMKYQQWDCVSITEDKLLKFAQNVELREKAIRYSRNSFMKVYPTGMRFDSSNCDPTKSWICGAQISALNLQSTDDDFVLLNKVFFQINRGLGFILKPEFLRNENAEVKTYKNPCLNLFIKIISGVMLQNILKVDGVVESIDSLAVSIKIVGSYEDDINNKEYFTKYINQNFINPIFDNETVNFKVYEADLSFLIIKVFYSKNILARTIIPLMIIEEGIRTVKLYDNKCKEIVNSTLVLKVNKTPLTMKDY